MKLIVSTVKISCRWLGLWIVFASLSCALLAPHHGTGAKGFEPDYLVVLLPESSIELSKRDVEAWLADAERVEMGAPATRPAVAFDAVAFWGPTTLTQEQRLAFASSEVGRNHAGWWAPEGSGGTILLRSSFGTVAGSASLAQETMYRTSRPVPTHASSSGASEDESGDELVPVGIGVMAVAAVGGSAIWFVWRRKERARA
jgi:hypothetical protein